MAAGDDRILWRGHCGVAEYAFDQEASLPRWTLPEETEVVVTDRRVVYAYRPDPATDEVTSGEMRWLWPQFLRLQPGRREPGRTRSVAQVQLVCGGSDGSFPALVFAGGDLSPVARADRMANVLRQAIARFRLDHAAELGLAAGPARMLSKLLIGPEFLNHEGGDGQTVSLLGALPVARPEPVDPVAAVVPDLVVPDVVPVPDLEARAARVAALMAELDAAGDAPERYEMPTVNLRRPASRLAANSGRARTSFVRRPERGAGGIAARMNRSG